MRDSGSKAMIYIAMIMNMSCRVARTPGGLVTQLNRHGLHARPARNTALITLAADLPAAVLADLIGMHPATAVRWARLSSSDWSAYLAAEPGHSTRRR